MTVVDIGNRPAGGATLRLAMLKGAGELTAIQASVEIFPALIAAHSGVLEDFENLRMSLIQIGRPSMRILNRVAGLNAFLRRFGQRTN